MNSTKNETGAHPLVTIEVDGETWQWHEVRPGVMLATASTAEEVEALSAHLPALRAELARRNLDHAREQARLPSPQPIDDTTPWEGVWLRSHAARADKPAPSGGRWCRGCGRTVVLTGVFCDLEVHGCLGRLRRIRAKTPPTRPDVT